MTVPKVIRYATLIVVLLIIRILIDLKVETVNQDGKTVVTGSATARIDA